MYFICYTSRFCLFYNCNKIFKFAFYTKVFFTNLMTSCDFKLIFIANCTVILCKLFFCKKCVLKFKSLLKTHYLN